MEILDKINSRQFYLLWRNLSIGIISIIIVMSSIKLLPVIFAPFISLLCAAFLYIFLYKNNHSKIYSCMIIPYAIMFCMIAFSFVLIVFNALYAFKVILIEPEFVYFHRPFVPILFLAPISTIVILIIYIRRNNLNLCIDCRITNGPKLDKGKTGNIINYEAKVLLRNILLIFFILSIITWGYYIFLYVDINITQRDSYVYTWLTVIVFLFDEIYFAFRYYNIYQELKSQNAIISQEELNDLSARTYIRIYVICGNHIYISKNIAKEQSPNIIIDTPFFSKRAVNGMTFSEVKEIIINLTGISDGELRFFYGRISPDTEKIHLLRYFYFLDGDISQYEILKTEGEWVDYIEIQKIYMTNPLLLSPITIADTTRLATIIITEKMYNENGSRKNNNIDYKPTFSLFDVRNSKLDFQEDKWIEISKFNCDSQFFKLRKLWRKLIGAYKTKTI